MNQYYFFAFVGLILFSVVAIKFIIGPGKQALVWVIRGLLKVYLFLYDDEIDPLDEKIYEHQKIIWELKQVLKELGSDK